MRDNNTARPRSSGGRAGRSPPRAATSARPPARALSYAAELLEPGRPSLSDPFSTARPRTSTREPRSLEARRPGKRRTRAVPRPPAGKQVLPVPVHARTSSPTATCGTTAPPPSSPPHQPGKAEGKLGNWRGWNDGKEVGKGSGERAGKLRGAGRKAGGRGRKQQGCSVLESVRAPNGKGADTPPRLLVAARCSPPPAAAAQRPAPRPPRLLPVAPPLRRQGPHARA